jgi:hypothetical protein
MNSERGSLRQEFLEVREKARHAKSSSRKNQRLTPHALPGVGKGVRHCVGVASGTEAIALSLMALGIGSGDEGEC